MLVEDTLTFVKQPLRNLPEELEIIYRQDDPATRIDFWAADTKHQEVIIHAHVGHKDNCAVMLWRRVNGNWEVFDHMPTGDAEWDLQVTEMLLDCSNFAHECLAQPDAQGIMVVAIVTEED